MFVDGGGEGGDGGGGEGDVVTFFSVSEIVNGGVDDGDGGDESGGDVDGSSSNCLGEFFTGSLSFSTRRRVEGGGGGATCESLSSSDAFSAEKACGTCFSGGWSGGGFTLVVTTGIITTCGVTTFAFEVGDGRTPAGGFALRLLLLNGAKTVAAAGALCTSGLRGSGGGCTTCWGGGGSGSGSGGSAIGGFDGLEMIWR